ncbi:hypothetical protein FQN60_014995 [Etheostoma spectabile]|uniref:CWH43-like N-terminal domain-containing protein n=1 Tax=Etheostoma spectabile TaxID=54343 RepID=A0A5J5CPZ0_9PERO|nr:hypothetical protein FQN60_014995 [Etheostoma spectabile]
MEHKKHMHSIHLLGTNQFQLDCAILKPLIDDITSILLHCRSCSMSETDHGKVVLQRYGLAFTNSHVCSLSDWGSDNYCTGNQSTGCCLVPTISLFHHAHIMEKHTCHSMLSRFALVFGVVAALGAFTAGNCNPGYLALLHYLGAAISFVCICFYTVLLTALTGKCLLTGYEKILYPLRIASTVVQTIDEYFYVHLSAIFEWMLSINLELFELSFAVEFCFFSSFMLSNLLSKREEEKPLMMTMS